MSLYDSKENLTTIFLTKNEFETHFVNWKTLNLTNELDSNSIKKLQYKRILISIEISQWLAYLISLERPYERTLIEYNLIKKIKSILRIKAPFYVEITEAQKKILKFHLIKKYTDSMVKILNELKTYM